jgi:hypothetical protein
VHRAVGEPFPDLAYGLPCRWRYAFCGAPGDGPRLIATRRQPLMPVILQYRIRNVERACRRRIPALS